MDFKDLATGVPELITVLATPDDGSGTYLTPMLWSSPGEGKSSLVRSLFKGQRSEIVSAALHEPFDFGGFPVPHSEQSIVRYLPPDWAVFEPEEPGCIFLDDVNLASPQTMSAVMKLALERTIGTSYRIGANVKIILAGNPSEGTELIDPVANRMIHINYEMSVEKFSAALKQGKYEPPPRIARMDPVLHQQVRQLYRQRVAHFLDRFPKYVQSKRNPSNEYPNSFASKRSWEMLTRLLATAESLGLTPTVDGERNSNGSEACLRLISGTVGLEVAFPFIKHLHIPDDIASPRLILSGEAVVNYERINDDLVHALFCGLGLELTRLESCGPKDFLTGAIFFCEQIERLGNRIDIVYAPIRSLVRSGWFGRASAAAIEVEAVDEWQRVARQVFRSDGEFAQLGSLIEKEATVG
jgi:hypothetical protein